MRSSKRAKARETGTIPPPAWMRLSERQLFEKVVRLRSEAGNPLQEGEIDLVADYVAQRTRVDLLRKAADRALRKAGGFPPDERHAMALGRACMAETRLAHRLAQRIGLTP